MCYDPRMMSSPLDLGALAPVFCKHALSVAVLHGSRASGRARPTSDVDLAVLHQDGRRLTFGELGLFRLDAVDALGGDVDVDVMDLATADPLARFAVLQNAQVLLASPREHWTQLVTQTLIEHDEIAPFLPELVAGVRRAALEASP